MNFSFPVPSGASALSSSFLFSFYPRWSAYNILTITIEPQYSCLSLRLAPEPTFPSPTRFIFLPPCSSSTSLGNPLPSLTDMRKLVYPPGSGVPVRNFLFSCSGCARRKSDLRSSIPTSFSPVIPLFPASSPSLECFDASLHTSFAFLRLFGRSFFLDSPSEGFAELAEVFSYDCLVQPPFPLDLRCPALTEWCGPQSSHIVIYPHVTPNGVKRTII